MQRQVRFIICSSEETPTWDRGEYRIPIPLFYASLTEHVKAELQASAI
jgi:hypothetical protein